MNWQAISFDWNQVRAFLATAEEGTLSAGARALGLSQPTIGRQVAALEAALGVTLFERAGKGLVLTRSGVDLLEHVREMATAATRISLSAAGHAQDVAGEVRISASDALSAYILPPMLARLRGLAPDLVVEVVAENRLSDLLRREADIAIRHVRPDAPDLIARRLKDETGSLYAAASWIARHGRPRRMADLAGHDFVGIEDDAQMVSELAARGVDISGVRFVARSANTVVMWEMVRAGLGIGVMSDRVAATCPDVERIDLKEVGPIGFPVWLTAHRELHNSRRIRVVFDFLAEQLGAPQEQGRDRAAAEHG